MSRSLGLLSGLIGSFSAVVVAQTPLPQPPAEYQVLTNHPSRATNLNIETVRGMVVASDGSLYAINTHGSRIVRHTNLHPTAEADWPTVQNPIAIAMYADRLLVVGGGSWSLVEHDRQNGRILRHVALAAEPADIVVDAGAGLAYVACQGDNVVVRIDLATFTETARYAIPSQRPRHLHFEVSPQGGRHVHVTPHLSGNNSTVTPQSFSPASPENHVLAQVVDLDLHTSGTDLPDEDLYRIDTQAPPATAVVPVLHNAGTILTEHARHPQTGAYWLLSTESKNGDPAQQGEHRHRGVFANAQLAIATNLGQGVRPQPTVIDLDKPVAGTKSHATSMAAPSALAFHSSGVAAIAAASSDLLTFTNSGGVRLFDRAISAATQSSMPVMPPQPGRAIPRDLLFDPTGQILFVYCWGWNKVLAYQWNNIVAPPFWLDLGLDPQPLAVQRGRSTFYDARRSPTDGMPGAVTCATCHPGGGMDMLGWQLSASTRDRKDVMVTQSLLGIADTFPYHWRGENNLDHFNGAFVELLGQSKALDEAPGGELDEFEAFVFSLQPPANPRQHVDRVLDGAAARIGQDLFVNKPNVLGQFTCANCHAMPSGTNGERLPDFFAPISSTSTLDVAHLRQLRHKDQASASVVMPAGFLGAGAAFPRARNGFGIAHQGDRFDLADFLSAGFNLTPAEQQQVVAFVRQFDQGIAPAAHRTYAMTLANVAAASQDVQNVLLVQAAPAKRWIDVAVIGYEPVGAATVDLRWAYDPTNGLFSSHDASQPPRPLSTFTQKVTNGGASYVFVGLPPGNARRFALDPDNDDLIDAQEATAGTAPRSRDTDGDGYEDGYEVQVASNPLVFNTPTDNVPPALRAGTSLVVDHFETTFAKFRAQFSEPASWVLEMLDVGGNVVSRTRGAALQREAVVHAHELYPSTPAGDVRSYVPRLRLTDVRGNVATILGASIATPPLQMLGAFPGRLTAIVDDIKLQPVQRSAGTMQMDATVNVRTKGEANGRLPLPGRFVLAHVLVRTGPDQPWTISRNTPSQTVLIPQASTILMPTISFSPGPVAYASLPGDFLVAPTDSLGNALFSFKRQQLAPGHEVRLAILAVLTPGTIGGTFDAQSLFDWDLPTTSGGATPTVPSATDRRGVTATY